MVYHLEACPPVSSFPHSLSVSAPCARLWNQRCQASSNCIDMSPINLSGSTTTPPSPPPRKSPGSCRNSWNITTRQTQGGYRGGGGLRHWSSSQILPLPGRYVHAVRHLVHAVDPPARSKGVCNMHHAERKQGAGR